MASNYKTGASLNLTSFEMQLLSRSPLFRGAGESGIGEMLSCLGAEERSYEKEEMIYRAGNTVTSLGVVMHGSVMIVNDDLWGNRSILDRDRFLRRHMRACRGKSCWSMCLQRR